MPKVVYVNCPECGREFYVGREFFDVAEAYCHCPFCNHEFNPQQAARESTAAHAGY